MPRLTLSVEPQEVKIGGFVDFYGRLTHDGVGLENKIIVLMVQWGTTGWRGIEGLGAELTDSEGNYIFRDVRVSTHYGGVFNYQARFAGDNQYARATSNIVKVVVVPDGEEPQPKDSKWFILLLLILIPLLLLAREKEKKGKS